MARASLWVGIEVADRGAEASHQPGSSLRRSREPLKSISTAAKHGGAAIARGTQPGEILKQSWYVARTVWELLEFRQGNASD